jgi:simple sugar transport system permease protein
VHREVTIFAVLVVLIVFFAVKNSEFLTYDNIVTIGQYVAPVAVIGAGEVLLLTLGEIDLSAGQTFLLSAWITLWLQQDGIPIGWAIVISLLCCVAVGLFNGLFTIMFNVPSFVTTLGTYYALLGVVLIVSNDEQVSMVGITGRFGQIFGMSNWAELFWALGIVVVLHVLLKGARFGWHVTATGGNKLGASEAGIPANRVKIWCFVIVALGAGFIGILVSTRPRRGRQ